MPKCNTQTPIITVGFKHVRDQEITHENVLTHFSLHQLSAKMAKEGVTGMQIHWIVKDGQDQKSKK